MGTRCLLLSWNRGWEELKLGSSGVDCVYYGIALVCIISCFSEFVQAGKTELSCAKELRWPCALATCSWALACLDRVGVFFAYPATFCFNATTRSA